MTPGWIINPLMAAELHRNKRPIVFLGKGPLKSEAIMCTPISGVNTSLVVVQMSSPALPVVALLGMPVDDCAGECVEGLAMVWESAAWPHMFVGLRLWTPHSIFWPSACGVRS